MINKDQLNMVPAHATLHAAYACLDGAQSEPPAMRVMGVAVLFREMCLAQGLDPGEMLDKARRVCIHAQDHYSLELRALRDYMKKEL